MRVGGCVCACMLAGEFVCFNSVSVFCSLLSDGGEFGEITHERNIIITKFCIFCKKKRKRASASNN